MSYTQFTRTFDKGQEIFAQTWEKIGAKGVAVLVHGLGEHSSRYRHVAEAFNQQEFSMVGFDLPGHGRSGGKRGHIPSYEYAMKIIQYFLDYAKKRFPELPVFLYGHSMGGSLALYYGLTRTPDIAGMIVTSPGLGTATPLPPLKALLAKILARLAPSFTMPNGLDLDGLSRDRTVIEKYTSDPLVTTLVSAALGTEIINKGAWMLKRKHRLAVPLLLIQGTSDRVVNPLATHNLSTRIEGDFTYKEWDGFYHELHNEPEKEEVLQFILQWMNNTMNR